MWPLAGAELSNSRRRAKYNESWTPVKKSWALKAVAQKPHGCLLKALAMSCTFSIRASCHRQIFASSLLIVCALFFRNYQSKLIGREFFSPDVVRRIDLSSPVFALKFGRPRESSPETIAIPAWPRRLEAARESS